jgi:hypothetical protein
MTEQLKKLSAQLKMLSRMNMPFQVGSNGLVLINNNLGT